MVTTPRKPLLFAASDRASRWILAAAVSGSALAVGTVHTITLCVVTGVLAVSAALAWWRAEPVKVRPAATLLLFIGIGLVAYTLFQCVPMPIRMLAMIAPHNADVWSRAFAPLHEAASRWAPITLDPPASRIEVLKGIAYLLAFLTAIRVAHKREGVAFLSAVIVITGVALAAAALLHPAFGAHKLFGIYEPGPGTAATHLAPLLDPNSLASYLNIAFCITLAASLSRDPKAPRSITIALAILLAGTQVWIASRGGVIAMVLGALTVAALSLSERVKRRDPRIWLTLGCGAATLIGGAFILIGSSTKVHNELFDDDFTKFSVVLEALKMLPTYGIFGSGRGSFESVFPQFRSGEIAWGHLTYTHPENIVAQWTVEWGVPIGMIGLLLIVFALRPTAALARSRTASGAWAALATVAAQNMSDLGSEIPGLMLSVTICAAIVVAGSAGLAPKWSLERWSLWPSRVAFVAAAASVLAIAAGTQSLGRHVVEDRQALHDAAIVRRLPVEEVHALARTAMSRHPAEPYLPFVVALRATRARDDNPLPWLGATIERARVYGPAHLLLARLLATRSPSQARLEYRLAIDQAPELIGIATPEAARVVGSYDDAMELVSTRKLGLNMLQSLSATLSLRLPATSLRLDEELSARAPRNPQPTRHAASDSVADLEGTDETSWCEGATRFTCRDRALSSSKKLEDLEPTTCAGYALEARALAAVGETGRAMQRLESIVDKVNDRVTCLQALVDLARTAKDETRLNAALNEVVHAGCADESQCQSNLLWVAQVQEADGSPRRALATYKRAYERAPENDALLESIARLSAAAGMNVEALKDYEELARRHPEESKWGRAVEEQREAMMRGIVKL